MQGEIVERTVAAMVAEIRQSAWRGRPAKTIFFGGGTPTYLSESQIVSLIEAVIAAHPPIPDAEITSEGNPGTVDMPKFKAMRDAGFNRISLGAQSFVPEDLIRLGRVHQAAHIGRAVLAAREAGFDNLNLDLMFGLPAQSARAWEQNLDLAFALKPDHLSLYCLTIEPNTRFYRLNLRGMLDLADDDGQTAMYDQAVDRAREAGYEQYEISNFAKPGRECLHNLCYWLGEEYLAYGPGAVGCVESGPARVRYTNMKHPERYCAAVEARSRLWCEEETVGADEQRTERLMLGLRLNRGVDAPANVDPGAIRRLSERGWLEPNTDRLRLTPAGRHFCSEATVELL
jgi:oxygen-independent coproporphyrinogen-3 oxidase